jgi:hypothetical protein
MAEETKPYEYQEFPKALYASFDPGTQPLIVNSEAEEAALREKGAKPLVEWWAAYGVPDTDDWLARAQSKAAEVQAAAAKAAAEAATKVGAKQPK